MIFFYENPSKIIADQIPDKFETSTNYPNPFNSSTNFVMYIEQEAEVSIEIFDILGRLVAEHKFETLEKGVHSYKWEGRRSDGNLLPSGIYFYNLYYSPINGSKPKIVSNKTMLLK